MQAPAHPVCYQRKLLKRQVFGPQLQEVVRQARDRPLDRFRRKRILAAPERLPDSLPPVGEEHPDHIRVDPPSASGYGGSCGVILTTQERTWGFGRKEFGESSSSGFTEA